MPPAAGWSGMRLVRAAVQARPAVPHERLRQLPAYRRKQPSVFRNQSTRPASKHAYSHPIQTQEDVAAGCQTGLMPPNTALGYRTTISLTDLTWRYTHEPHWFHPGKTFKYLVPFPLTLFCCKQISGPGENTIAIAFHENSILGGPPFGYKFPQPAEREKGKALFSLVSHPTSNSTRGMCREHCGPAFFHLPTSSVSGRLVNGENQFHENLPLIKMRNIRIVQNPSNQTWIHGQALSTHRRIQNGKPLYQIEPAKKPRCIGKIRPHLSQWHESPGMEDQAWTVPC